MTYVTRPIDPTPELAARLWASVDTSTDGCWEWKLKPHHSGYGALSLGHEKVWAHRVAYTLAYGPIPDGLHVCHRCDNRKCCRPDHLFLGTNLDNVRDMVAKGRNRGYLNAGSANGCAKLTEAQVAEIRRRWVPGAWASDGTGCSSRELGAEFGVYPGHIPALGRGRRRPTSLRGGPVSRETSHSAR